MQRYKNVSGNSGVRAYEIGATSIVVEFTNGGVYLYDHERPGAAEVEKMKTLAQAGHGLSAFITQHVRERYARKVR